MNTDVIMSDKEFNILRKLIYDTTGINLQEHKKTMLVSRLKKRLLALGLNSYGVYYKILLNDKHEVNEMINVVSTNKTEFFREKHHFEFFEEIIPSIIEENYARNKHNITG